MTPTPSVRVAPSPLSLRRGDAFQAHSRNELRSIMHDELVGGSARWISLDGLNLDNHRSHSRLLRATNVFRRSVPSAAVVPHTAVLDWSTTRHVQVEALATFPLIAAAIEDFGGTVMCCEPREPEVARALVESGLARAVGSVWVGEDAGMSPFAQTRILPLSAGGVRHSRVSKHVRTQGLKTFSPVILCSGREPDCSEAFGEACGRAADNAVSRGASEEIAAMMAALARETVQNALGHSNAKRVSLAVGYSPGAVAEFAVADDGRGIASHMRSKVGVAQLDAVPERYFVADLLRGVYEREERGAGRGFVLGVRELLRQADATVELRTGGVFARVNRSGLQLAVLACTSHGFGTTVRVSVPIGRRGLTHRGYRLN